MNTDHPDPRLRAALVLVDSPYLDRTDDALTGDERESFDVLARIMGEFHALAPIETDWGTPSFRWGPLEVFDEIGSGSFGRVYRARDPRLDLAVALKLQRVAVDGDAHELLAEARRSARVRHMNVCAVLGADVHDRQVGLWTEFVAGRTLNDRLNDGCLSVAETIRVGMQIAQALHAVHTTDLVHGDVTASNVIEGPDGRIVLTDFGSSAVGASDSPRTGTPVAMAPELFSIGALTVASDVYALGALLFRLLTGEHLIVGRTLDDIIRAHGTGSRRTLSVYRDDLPPALVETIAKATEPTPSDRFSSASEFHIALSSSGEVPTNLPTLSTSFVGRETETDAIRAAWTTNRLVTLLGAGGVGKTRLAIEAATRERPSFAHGAWWVELDDVSGPDAVASTVGTAIGLDAITNPLELATAVRDRRMLIVLDNVERVAAAVIELVAEVMASAPQVSILCTSRVALHLSEESPIILSPLSCHSPDGPSLSEQLFVDRLGAHVVVDDGSREHIERICRRVDGIPLAIELAASRGSTLGLAELDRRLEHELSVLANPRSPRPKRHRTMRALVEWSADLLDDAASKVLTILGVFPGTFTLVAAEEIAAAVEPLITDPAHVLIRLIEDSFLTRVNTRTATDVDRFRLLAPVREFAAARLAAGKAAETKRVFDRWYETYAIEVGRDDASPAAIHKIHAEYHNIHLAYEAIARDGGDRVAAGNLAIALFYYWYGCFSREEAVRLLGLVLPPIDEIPATEVAASLQYLAGSIEGETGDGDSAGRRFKAAQSGFRSLGNRLKEAKAVSALGVIAGRRFQVDRNPSDMHEAVRLLEEGNAVYRDLNESALEAEGLNNIGSFYLFAVELSEAKPYFERSLDVLRRVEDPHRLTLTLMNRARVGELEGSESASAAFLIEAREQARRSMDEHLTAWCDALYGEILAKMGDVDSAIPILEGSLRLSRRIRNQVQECFSLVQLARCDIDRADGRGAAAWLHSCADLIAGSVMREGGDLSRFLLRESGYTAMCLGDWSQAAVFLKWTADSSEQSGRAVSPHERARFARADQSLAAHVGAGWRDAADELSAESAFKHARDWLGEVVRRN